MAEFAFRHALHNAADRIVHVAGGNFTRHNLRNRQLQTGTSGIRHRVHDIALRHRMPTRRPPASRTTSAPMRCVESNFAAAARSAVGSMQMMLSPLAARMVFKLMPGSVKDDFVPILWSGARCVYRRKNCRCWVRLGPLTMSAARPG